MRKKIFFLIFLILIGTLSYFGGYYLYVSENPKERVREQNLMKSGMQTDSISLPDQVQQDFYFAQIEQEMLMIYRMPDGKLYDSVELSSLHVPESELLQLMEGVRFENLRSVFEYLENSMS